MEENIALARFKKKYPSYVEGMTDNQIIDTYSSCISFEELKYKFSDLLNFLIARFYMHTGQKTKAYSYLCKKYGIDATKIMQELS